jgi:hypothetical protein
LLPLERLPGRAFIHWSGLRRITPSSAEHGYFYLAMMRLFGHR